MKWMNEWEYENDTKKGEENVVNFDEMKLKKGENPQKLFPDDTEIRIRGLSGLFARTSERLH